MQRFLGQLELKRLNPLLIAIVIFCEWWDAFNKVVSQTWRLPYSYHNLPLHLQQYTRVYSLWFLYLAIFEIRPRACFTYGDFIDRGRLLTIQRVGQGYTLEKLKIYFRKSYDMLIMGRSKTDLYLSDGR